MAANLFLEPDLAAMRAEVLAEAAARAGALPFESLNRFKARHVRWVDPPFLQGSAFHLLAGRKGTCKGTYLAGLAARLSTGRLGPIRRTLMVTSEDSIEIDFLPRVIAAGGDPRLIEVLRCDFRLPRDIEGLRASARERGDVGLIVIDPVGNHLSNTDTDGEGSVRNAIGPLNELADDLDCMIIGVRHLTKSAANGALASVLGSTAWVDVPRCVILMAADLDDPEWTFHYQVVAGNRGPRGAGRKLTLSVIDITMPDDPETFLDITRVTEAGESDKDVEELLLRGGAKASESRSAQARALILSILETEGTQESDALDARVAAEVGLKTKTVKNNRSKLADEGLIRMRPDRDEHGEIPDGGKWHVERTHAPSTPTLGGSSRDAADDS